MVYLLTYLFLELVTVVMCRRDVPGPIPSDENMPASEAEKLSAILHALCLAIQVNIRLLSFSFTTILSL